MPRRARSAGAVAMLLAAGLARGALAQPPGERLDLLAAMRRARERAPEAAAALARQRAAAAREREARAYRLPRLEAAEMWMRTDSPAAAFALQLNQERFSFDDFLLSDPNDPGAVENAATRLELVLPLYTGGEISARISQAADGAAAGAAAARRTGDAAAAGAGRAWVELAQSREHVALLKASLATVERHAHLTRAYVEQGMLVASELLRAEVERSRVADLLAAARGQARMAEAALSFQLGADQGSRWELASLPEPAPATGGLDTWLANAATRPDLEAAERRAAIARREVAVRRAARRPEVGLTARYEWNDPELFGGHGEAAAAMVAARLEVFAGGRHEAAAAAAAAEAEAAALEAERFAEGVRLEVREAWERLESALDRHATAGAALTAAAEAERILQERFRQGVVKTLDVLDAATARREAQTRELVARAEAHLAALGLALAAGRAPETAVGATASGRIEEASAP